MEKKGKNKMCKNPTLPAWLSEKKCNYKGNLDFTKNLFFYFLLNIVGNIWRGVRLQYWDIGDI